MTGQRKGVFEALFKQTGHFTAEQLLQDAHSLDDTVSRATVYRCLPLLVEVVSSARSMSAMIISFILSLDLQKLLKPKLFARTAKRFSTSMLPSWSGTGKMYPPSLVLI